MTGVILVVEHAADVGLDLFANELSGRPDTLGSASPSQTREAQTREAQTREAQTGDWRTGEGRIRAGRPSSRTPARPRPPVETHVVRPYLGDAIPELGSGRALTVPPGRFGGSSGPQRYAGLIVLGGSMAAWEDEVAPWLPATRTLIADAVRTGLPTLGICLGAQLLALACGGRVERGVTGRELGVVPVAPLPAAAGDEFFGPIATALAADRTVGRGADGEAAAEGWLVRQYHQDVVTRLPPDAEPLVTGQTYPYQGFRVGRAAWGVQYHPEVSTAGFAAWVRGGRESGSLGPEGDLVLGPVEASAAEQDRVAAAHARSFVAAVAAAQATATGTRPVGEARTGAAVR